MTNAKWIKVATDMFDSNLKIGGIEAMPKGDTILVIWLKLLLLASEINDGGAIYVTREIPHTVDSLAFALRKTKKAVMSALEILEEYEMVKRDEGGVIYILSEGICQNEDRLLERREKDRIRQQRARQRRKNAKNNSDMSRDTPSNNSDMSRDTPSPSSLPLCSPSLSSPTPLSITPPIIPLIPSPSPMSSSSSFVSRVRAQQFAGHYWGRNLQRYEEYEICKLVGEHISSRDLNADLSAGDIELLEIAFKASADAASPSISYIRGIYERWGERGIHSPDEYWANEAERDIASGKLNRIMKKRCARS